MLLSRKIQQKLHRKYFSEVARFRNAEYKFCNFSELKFIDNPEKQWCEEEGYKFSKIDYQFPLVNEDPCNFYSNICVGYSKPIEMKVTTYHKELHKKFRIYEFKKDYDTVDTFGKEIFCVDFINSIISLSRINEYNFKNCNINNTIFNEVELNKLLFTKTNFSHSLLENCLIINTEFDNAVPSHFYNTTFINVDFINTNFNRSRFDNCIFVACTFDEVYFYQCYLSSRFIDCQFIDLKTLWCTTPAAKEYNFNLNYFKALCQNCTFE